MSRYTVIESKAWKCDDGRTASLYGAVPWTSEGEASRWKLVTRGYTVQDNVTGTIGIGRVPWPTRAEAEAWADVKNAEHDARHRAWAAANAKAASKPARKKRK
jgi:hypothetical protein